MTYYPDLSCYRYCKTEKDPRVLNIGWLEAGRGFPRGEVPSLVPRRLLTLTEKYPVNAMRGMHWCDFCEERATPFGGLCVQVDDREVDLGSAEIRVGGRDGIWYAAPDMIYHYIVSHRYRPPAEFLEAVLAYDPESDP